MPIYLYKCQDCGYESEELILGKTKYKTKKCLKCEKGLMKKQPTSTSLKGGSKCSSCAKSCSSCH